MTSMSQSAYEGGDVQRDVDSDIDNLDFNNFKGIYFDEDPNRKYQDPETGCHFEYYDLCKRLAKLKQLRRKLDEQLGLPPETPEDRKGIYQPNHQYSHSMTQGGEKGQQRVKKQHAYSQDKKKDRGQIKSDQHVDKRQPSAKHKSIPKQ